MKKDVIYIDIEDDITSIIDKLKNSAEKIVALVPPKGNAVLQSVVNLKLLKRAASGANKQLVVVTSNQALTALAGGLELYVAKNLQSKPVLAGTAVSEPLEDESLEVSDTIDEVAENTSVDISGDDEVELSSEELAVLEASDAPVDRADTKTAKKPKKGAKSGKVPNFDSFRKKLLIGGGIALLLIVVLLAVFGRAKASIVVRAETTPVDIALEAKLSTNIAQSDPSANTLKARSQEKKQTISQTFAATGQKDIGQKATGRVKLSKLTQTSYTVPAGTRLTANNDTTFTTNEAATIPASVVCFPSFCAQSVNVDVTATDSGVKSNGASGNLSGAPSGTNATFTNPSSGGTSQIAKVVTQEDINKARTQLDQQDSAAVKAELSKAFGEGVKVLDDSFNVSVGAVNSEPGVDQQANEAKLSAEVTYSILGVQESDLGAMLDAAVTSQMTNKEQQRVYDNGLSNAKFEKVSSDSRTASYKITALAQYGPQFDTERLKEEVTGKKFGEVRSYLQDLPGVKGVDIKLSPFWARRVPGVNRIDIKLEVDKNNGG